MKSDEIKTIILQHQMRDPSERRLTIFEGIVRADFGIEPGDAHFDY